MAGTVANLDGRIASAATVLEERGLSLHDTIPAQAVLESSSAEPLPLVSLDDAAIDGASIDGRRRKADLIELGTLGEGGMGRVLLARQRSLEREVAVKTVKPGASRRECDGLLREARISGSLEHPGIVPVHALGVDAEGRPLLVMKRVLGTDWETLLGDASHPEWSKVVSGSGDRLDANLEILARICHALELAHSHGIVHRDVKPANVMVGPFGEVYLADWGIATANGTREEALVGTPTYMAPEMIVGEPLDERTDVFLLGAVLHRIVVGRERYAGETLAEIVTAAAACEPYAYPPSVALQLAALCLSACARDPASRPPSARAFRDQVVAFSRHRSAIVLSEAALERLAELEAMLAATGEAPPADRVRAHRLAAEARFGILFCLRTYPEHHAAVAGLARCFRALVDLELRQGHVDAAVAVLGEMTDVDASLVTRVDRARKAKEEEAREHERLRALDRDQDASIAKRERVWMFGTVLVLNAVLAAFGQFGKTNFSPGDATLVWLPALLLAFSLVLATVLRRRLMATAFNRNLAVSLFCIMVVILLNRALAVARATPVHLVFATDCLVMIVATAIVSFTQLPRLALVAVPLVIGLAGILWVPETSPQTFGIASCIAFACSAWALWTGRARAVATS